MTETSSADLPFVTQDQSIRDTMVVVDRYAQGIALLVDEEHHLIATITDGDIRRAILARLELDSSVKVLTEEPRAGRSKPLTAAEGTPEATLIELMNEHQVRQIPLFDDSGVVVDMALLTSLVKERELPIEAMVMAGGYGTRLRPLTDDVPKPMVEVQGQPILERIVRQLRSAGIRNVSLATRYRKEVITDHFGDGRDFGVSIEYVEEGEPLGTAGALGLMSATAEPILVINGDILTRVDFRAMLDFHREHKADMTMAVKQYDIPIPFGVVETVGTRVTSIQEKPTIRHFINAGIYLLNPDVRQLIPRGEPYDMPDLISRLLSDGRMVVSFPVHEYWLDIGDPADFERAQSDAGKMGAQGK